MENNKINIISKKIFQKYPKKLNDFTYICPDDRQYIKIGNLIKYVYILDQSYILKSGIVINSTIDKLFLKSPNSSLTKIIKFTDCHIFYKFNKNDFINTINDFLQKN